VTAHLARSAVPTLAPGLELLPQAAATAATNPLPAEVAETPPRAG
jgi:hypothetical protein